MIKLIKKTFYTVLIFLVLIVSLLSFLLSTTPGLYLLIKLSALALPGSLHVHYLSGNALKEFTVEEIDYQTKQASIKIKHITVNSQLFSLLQSQLTVNSLKANSVEIKQGSSITTLKNIRLTGQLNKDGITINSLLFDYANQSVFGKLQLNSALPVTLAGKLKLNPYSKKQEKPSGTLDLSGTLNQLQWTGDFHGPAELSVNGSLNNLSQLNQTIKWRNIKWQTSPESIFNSPEGRITIKGTLPKLDMELRTKLNKLQNENWQLAANIHGSIPWKWHFDAHLSQVLDSSAHPGIYTSFSAEGGLEDSNKGNITIKVHPGHYEMPKDSQIPSLKFAGGTLKATLTPRQLKGEGSLAIDDNKKLNLVFELPKFNLAEGLSSNQPITANLSLIVNSLAFLQDLSPDIANPKGHLTASLKTTGTWGKKIIKTTLALNKASVDLPVLGLKLHSIDFTAHAKEQQWEANGLIIADGKKINIRGKGPLSTSFIGDLSLEGIDFPIINTKEFQVNISPQLNLNVTAEALNITGSILVPSAHIKPQTFSNSITLSDDVVFKTKNEKPPTPFNTKMNLRVEMGNEVELTYKGLHATLAGIVNLNQQPQGPVNATGELTVKKGEYKAYGQDLAIEQGQLIFTGGRLDNPGINLRASKKIDTTSAATVGTNQPFDFSNNNLQNANVRGNISVGVEVSGRLTEPKILLFSNPAILSQADILSMLVLGRPASQANKAGGQLLLAAISSMNLGNGTNGTQLLEQLKKNLGFDFNVQTTSNYNLATNQISDTTAFVVGKSISKQIYVSYNVGLSQADPNVLTLKYLLNKFYSIQISSSTTSSGIDVLYTSSK